MKRPKQEQPPTVHVGDHTDRLSRIGKRISYEDERPSREDLKPQGSQLFKLPELPKFLRAKRDR
jgi:hypothetical protein